MYYSICWRLWSFRNLLVVLEVMNASEGCGVCYSVCWRRRTRRRAGRTGGDALCTTLCMSEAVEFSKFAGGVGGAGRVGGDALCATHMPEAVEGGVRRCWR